MVSLLVLSFLIFFHELGHYSAARFFGVYVEVFSIGFGKKIASFQLFNTEWRIAAIPLGGYVKMKGQNDVDPADASQDDDSYNTKAPWQRVIILLAGPFANFLVAFFLYLAIAFGGVQALSPVIGDVMPDSAAHVAGLQKNDVIVAINSESVTTWKEMAKRIQTSPILLQFQIERNGFLQNIEVTPKIQESKNMFGETIQKPMIGITSAGVLHDVEMNFTQKFDYAYEQTIFASMMIFKGVQKLITGDVPAKELGGVISIVKVTADASESGWMAVFFFAALISVNLGVLNLLPIPALDGGHIMFNLYEMVTKNAPSEAVLIKLTVAGWGVLLGLMSLGLYNDINRLIG
jgi:regulator of sigma E protease